MILVKMRECAEEFTQLKPIKDAVITCPAYFNDAQRQATRDAGEIAGLNVLSVINEPTAAAIAYGLERKQEKKSHVLVYDFGGGTLDCSLLTIEKGDFKVLSTNGNTHLGGEDFDNALMSYCTKEFQNTSGIDISKSAKSMRRMKAEVQKAKHMLSTSTEYEMTLDSLAKD
jgi:L1 cell adhesion molecule like protein